MIKDTDLRELLSHDAPFGPNASDKISDRLYKQIFSQDNSAYESLRTRPFLIVGRRGAGKTAILSAIRNGERFSLTAEIPSDETFQEIIDRLDQGIPDTILAETVGKVWEKLLWTVVFSEIAAHYYRSHPKQTSIIALYLQKIGVEPTSLPQQVIQLVVALMKRSSDGSQNALDALNEILDSKSGFLDTKNAALEVLTSKKIRAVILIDNVEQIDLEQKSHSLAVAGLLIAIDTFKNSEIPCEIRCCVPAEIFPRLTEIAANTDKSFDSQTVLHWSSNELIRLAAIRYREFIRLHAPSNVWTSVVSLDLSNRRELDEFIHTFFPKTLKNGLGYEENTLRYILRHTQLLPRQFITYLNNIANKSFKKYPDSYFLAPECIVEAVSEREHVICQGIFGGYKKIHPDAQKVCAQMLPELGLTFQSGDFERLYRKKTGYLPNFPDNRACLQVLTEIGAVGVLQDETSTHLKAEFSYNLPLNLALRHGDTYCVHPAFSGAFRSRQDDQNYKPIYPRGSDVEI